MPISTSDLGAPTSQSAAEALKMSIAAEAMALGFDAVRFARADAADRAGPFFDAFLAQGRHGDMAWLAANPERRKRPRNLWPETRSIIMLGMSYAPGEDPLMILQEPTRGAISVYARGADYHELTRARLKALASQVQSLVEAEVKVFVDTAPVMEKPIAAEAGIGWQGKHTNLVSREFGSWLFLGSIFTTAEIPADEPEQDHCGACRRCLDICPTNAFPVPYELDARRCISYLTIEHKGHIDREFREAIANRIFGCDDCLAVCPWNKFAHEAREVKLAARAESDNPPLTELLDLDDAAFRARFRGTAIKRTGRDQFVRNVLIAAGNSGDPTLLPKIEARLGDVSPLVRAMAVWALSRLAPDRFKALRASRAGSEPDTAVASEWSALQ
jgi:epoxyqueuosine reductase